MPHIHFEAKQVVFKLVYYGPGMSGKTTNLRQLHSHLPADLRGEMLSLDTEEERTLFFDFFPLELGRVEGYGLRFNMYTVPGQVHYEASRRLILQGADGVVFVADSQPSRHQDNLESFRSLTRNLESYGVDWRRFPLVLQYNKRDVPDAVEVGVIERELDVGPLPVHRAIATTGYGVSTTMRTLSRLVLESFRL